MNIYLDESGDLGFKKGSTKYFTIALVVAQDPVRLRRCVKNVKVRYKIPPDVELKGSTTRKAIKKDLLTCLSRLDIEIYAITVEKRKIKDRLRQDTNILYNYMVGLSLVERILKEPIGAKVNVVVDRRITSITSGFRFSEYVRYKVWYDGRREDIDIDIHHIDSHSAYTIQGADIVCNTIHRKYDKGEYELFNIIKDKIKMDKELFFK